MFSLRFFCFSLFDFALFTDFLFAFPFADFLLPICAQFVDASQLTAQTRNLSNQSHRRDPAAPAADSCAGCRWRWAARPVWQRPCRCTANSCRCPVAGSHQFYTICLQNSNESRRQDVDWVCVLLLLLMLLLSLLLTCNLPNTLHIRPVANGVVVIIVVSV